ncbi:hypothetical protein [Streptomyces sp. Ag109_O5-1]|uniref:hypothetical protein n=1 Tax=Streptomyces sp. Ag109_O5-1 TaxID=1938851 RepID=UPI00162A93A2
MQALGRGFPAERFAWSAVEFGGDGVKGLRSSSAAVFPTGAFCAGLDLFHSLVPLLSPAATGAVAPDWLLGFCRGAGGLVGGYLGARLQPHLADTPLRLLLGTLATGMHAIRDPDRALSARGSALRNAVRRPSNRFLFGPFPWPGERQPMPRNQQTGQRNRPGNTFGLTPAASSRPLYGPWVLGTTPRAAAPDRERQP